MHSDPNYPLICQDCYFQVLGKKGHTNATPAVEDIKGKTLCMRTGNLNVENPPGFLVVFAKQPSIISLL